MKRIVLFFCLLFGFSMMALSQVDTVIFVTRGGFYDEAVQLEMFNYYPQNHIRYTINGNTPDASSPVYTGSLTLDSTFYSPSNIYTIVNSIPSIFYLPDDVQRAVVIRAAVFDASNHRLCEPVTNTYFIRSMGCDFHGLPVLSLVTDSLSLFDYETGIFVPGIHYNPADSLSTGNYKMKGDEWERKINMEFYEQNNEGINQICGLRTHGGASRWFQQKGMKLYARERYGKKRFSFPFFPTTDVDSFKHLCLHSFRSSNWVQTGGTEYIAQTIARQLDIDALAVREVVVFINGEYWGIYTMEEAPDERYVEDHYDVNLEEVAMIKYWGVPYYGNPAEWRNLLSWFDTADLTQSGDSAYAYDHIDVSCFLDYMLFETFTANLDWPSNNVKLWQPGPGGKFRWLFYDGDGCFVRPSYEATENALNQSINSRIFIRFRENDSFLNDFVARYEALYESYLGYDYMKSVLDEYEELVGGEVAAQVHRFKFPKNTNQWVADLGRVDDFMSQRDAYFRSELTKYYTFKEEYLQNNGLLCFPNPSSSIIHVLIQDEAVDINEIAIYDMLGRKVYAAPYSGEHLVINPHLPAGVYLLKAGRHTQRIVRYQ